MDILLTILAVFGVLALGWLLFERLITPVELRRNGALYAVIRASGEAGELEQEINGLNWMFAEGKIRLTRIIIADAGLSEGGHQVVRQLQKKWPDLVLCPADQVREQLWS